MIIGVARVGGGMTPYNIFSWYGYIHTNVYTCIYIHKASSEHPSL